MSRFLALELEQQYLKAMDPDLGPVFCGLSSECLWLHWKWDEYRILFGTPEPVETLRAAAGLFFGIVQDALMENVILHIARFVDSPKSAGKPNLTLRRLPGLVDAAIKAQTEQLLERCLEKTKFAIDWRHRHLAHFDLALALEKAAQPLADASRNSVQEAIDAITALLNSVDIHYRKVTVHYAPLTQNGNAESLLYVLKDGLEAEERRRERFQSGKLAPEDIDPPQPV